VTFDLRRRRLIVAILLAVAGFAILIWILGTREEWGPELATDPAYRSGRASVCRAPSPAGQVLPSEIQDLGLRPRDRGVERSRVYTFEASQFAGGAIDVCSEYGFVKVSGTSGTQGRVEIIVRNPFPGGERAVDDTRVAAELRVMNGRLQIGVAQLTQGVTSFRSFFAKGSRAATVDVVIQVPRSGAYELNMIANHQRITIQNLDVRGLLEGYASPGADINAGLDGPLTVRLNGVSYQAQWSGAGGLQGGTIARLRPLRSGSVEFKAEEGDVRLELVGNDVGLEVTTNSLSGDEIQIGPTDASRAERGSAYARSAGFERAAIQVPVRASSAKGSVTVKRLPN
jgi:hypothetical protein